ncbi:unnamed protein product [Lymnaea stagnalis]|uniref:BZIP domain-containing protein n=1 Tax=Lymnaea stagnalis TaxID=6523 RepID=A0AAV2HCT1_LYMST
MDLGNFDYFDSFCVDFEVGNSNTLFDVDNLLEGNDVNLASYNLITETDLSLPGFTTTTSASISSEDIQSKEKSITSLLAKSPWHESDTSDSGMSETLSSLGSPQPKTPLTAIVEDCKCVGSLTGFLVDENNTAYNNEHVCSNGVRNGAMENGRFLNVLRSKKAPSPKTLNNVGESENEDLNSEDMNLDEDDLNRVHQQKKCSQNHGELKSCKELRVVHVQPPNGVTNDEIMKALDERSKKNAQQAKLNREKKKAYIKSLEIDIDVLKTQNEGLKSENTQMKNENTSLADEIKYLKSVLANASALSNLLANISNVTEVKLSSSMRKRKAETDHNYVHDELSSKQSRMSTTNIHERAGICLHVSGNQASLEFCAHCSSMAKTTFLATSK